MLREVKRSEGGGWECALAAMLTTKGAAAVIQVGAVAGFLSGCGVGQNVGEALNPEPALDPYALSHERHGLTPARLEERMKEIDLNFEEPRTPARVFLSYEISQASISQANNYEALWRGARACAWLGANEPEPARREKFARDGVRMGLEAVRKLSNRVEPYYYLALSQMALLDLSGMFSRQPLNEIDKNLKVAIAIDETFDHCGPHRALGRILLRAEPYPLLAIGGLGEAEAHLRKAVGACSEYGENHLTYALVLIEAEKYDLARAELEQVMSSKVPRDRSSEHDAWLNQANELLVKIQGK